MDRPRRGVLRWALAGFGLGAVSATAYLLLGGEYFLFIPRWAEIVFYPGFLAGNAAYKWRLSQEASKVVGVLAVGLVYAALAALVRVAWSAVKHRRASAALNQNSA
ncbi:MAG TPA: hypothetical protein PK640_17215 [Verrucomicrobiota bacterium]|nr:hypothetical protein [Verrucomicrobiota bacterium]